MLDEKQTSTMTTDGSSFQSRRMETLVRATRTFPFAVVSLALLFGIARVAVCQSVASQIATAVAPDVAVGAQYDSTHVYVTTEDFESVRC